MTLTALDRSITPFLEISITSIIPVYLTDDGGRPVSGAWVQWIVFIPNPSLEVIGGGLTAGHGQHITFLGLSTTLIIVTTAQLAVKALISGAMNNSQTGFDLYLVNNQGVPVQKARVLWMAVVPKPANGFKGEVRRISNGENVGFSSAFPGSPAYVFPRIVRCDRWRSG